MKRNILIGIVLAMLVVVPAVAEETADAIIAKAIEAQGGADAWKAIESARMKGTMSMGPMEAPITVEFKRPNKFRVEFEMQGMTGVQAFDGETGWMLMPFMGMTEPQKMDDEMLKMAKQQGEFESPFIDYKDKGHSVELLGKEEVEGTEAYKIKLTRDTGDIDTYYFDAEYYLVFRTDSSRNFQGNEMEVTVSIGDYKEVGGLLFPHSMETAMADGPAMQSMTFATVETNIDIGDDRFAMPAEEGGEGEGE